MSYCCLFQMHLMVTVVVIMPIQNTNILTTVVVEKDLVNLIDHYLTSTSSYNDRKYRDTFYVTKTPQAHQKQTVLP